MILKQIIESTFDGNTDTGISFEGYSNREGKITYTFKESTTINKITVTAEGKYPSQPGIRIWRIKTMSTSGAEIRNTELNMEFEIGKTTKTTEFIVSPGTKQAQLWVFTPVPGTNPVLYEVIFS